MPTTGEKRPKTVPAKKPAAEPLRREPGNYDGRWTLRGLMQSLADRRPIRLLTNAEESEGGYITGPVVGLTRNQSPNPKAADVWRAKIAVKPNKFVTVLIKVAPKSGPWDPAY